MKLFTVIVGILIGLCALVAVIDGNRFMQEPINVAAPHRFVIDPGSSFNRVVTRLAESKILRRQRDVVWFKLLARAKGQAHAVKAGEYQVGPGLTPAQLLNLFVSGRTHQYSLTILEGWNFKQLKAAVDSNPVLEHVLLQKDGKAVMAAIGAETAHPEGQFFPDTYLFPRGTSDVEFLKRAHQRLKTVLASEWAGRADNLLIKTPYEALTLASIIEKETPLIAEHGEVSGVFHRRLKLGMRLQTDPTVIYGMGERYQGNIRRSDLRRDTPYNTYTRFGLPPTPIAMPGRAAIHAAVHPADGDTLYFVANGNGGHHFSRTLDEHNRAVRKYQLGKR